MSVKRNEAPIGVFDSGIGGLTVVRELIRELPSEGIVYLGDTARVPYGIRSAETVRRYAREGAEFLLSRGIKLLVVACNTVSAVGLEAIHSLSPVPVVGVIQPEALAAASMTRKKRVGVIGTEATVKSGAYAKAINRIDPGVEVSSRPCPLFVPLVEEGWLEGEVTELVARKYLGDLRARDIDTLVLGCTHYPLLKPVISKVMGPEVVLFDSATETARQVKNVLAQSSLDAPRRDAPSRQYRVTDYPEKFKKVGEMFLGNPIDDIEKVELEART